MGIWPRRGESAGAASTAPQPERAAVRSGPSLPFVWRSGMVLLAVVALGPFGRFVLTDAGSALFTIVMAWFAAVTMEPAIRRLTPRSPGAGRLAFMVYVGVYP